MCVCLLINRVSATLDLCSIENTLVSTFEVKLMKAFYCDAVARSTWGGPGHGVRDTKTLHLFVTVSFLCQKEHLYPTQDPHGGAGRP